MIKAETRKRRKTNSARVYAEKGTNLKQINPNKVYELGGPKIYTFKE